MPAAQALKANPERAPVELKVNANYITRFGQARFPHCRTRPACRSLYLCEAALLHAAP